MICNHCLDNSCVYVMTCEGCRTRLVQLETCKHMRKSKKDYIEQYYGEVFNWTEGKHCDCQHQCERKANVVQKSKDDEIDAGSSVRRLRSARRDGGSSPPKRR